MTKATGASSLLIVAASILLVSQLTEASSAASSSSTPESFKSGGFDNDSLFQPKKKRRRRRDRQKLDSQMKSGCAQSVIPLEHNITPLSTNHVSERETHLLSDDENMIASDQKTHRGDQNRTSTPRNRRRRRRKTNSKAGEGEVARATPSDGILQLENDDGFHQDMSDFVDEKGELYSEAIFPTKRLTLETRDSLSLERICASDSLEKITIMNHLQRQDISISSKSIDSNITKTESNDFFQQTETELISEIGTPPLETVFHSASESKKSLIKEINNSCSVTFQRTHHRNQRVFHIKTNSRPAQNNENIPKTQLSAEKLTNETKSSATRKITGKGGECLRRIKREWKDAVRMGTAYDWTNMRTITKNEGRIENDYVRLGPFGKNLLRWHFSVMGPANSVYENGIYHGRVLLPKDYPGSPPRVQMLTPSGRFVPGEDICLSASNYHPETWTPRWTVLSLVDALRLHMLTAANEIGGVVASDEKRKSYAHSSRSWCLPGVVDHGKMVAVGIFSSTQDSTETLERDISKQNGTSIKMPNDFDETNEHIESKLYGDIIGSQSPLTVDAACVKAKSRKAKRSKSTAVKVSRAKSSRKAIPPEDRALKYTIDDDIVLQRSVTKWLVIEFIKLPLRILSIVLALLSLLETTLTRILDRI